MATVKPFRAFRPAKGMAQRIASLPYDVFSREEARAYVEQHPDSFLAIDRPETQFPEDQDMYAPKVYRKARELLDEKIADGSFVQDTKPCYYLYEQGMEGRLQTGIVGCAAVDDYLNHVIKKHENTVAAKELDRIHHVDVCDAQTGPIFLAYRNQEAIDAVTERVRGTEPVYDFVSGGNVTNRVWVIDREEDIRTISDAFANVGSIYIADGHHRCASAVKVSLLRRKQHPEAGPDAQFNYFLSVLFPEEELEILPYNRVVTDVGGLDRSEILQGLKRNFTLEPYPAGWAQPEAKGRIGLYLGGRWYMMTAKNSIKSLDPVKGLDVSILQDTVLEPMFGIRNPRTDPRIRFIGGIRGLQELEKEADKTQGAAFAMYPTQLSELFAVADAGRLMPPKSTWFEPKLLSGLFIHRLG